MTSLDDSGLLRRYATEKSEAAFAELVRRHLNHVYAFALRRVGGDAHLAEDVTQIVFTTLARKAASLVERPVLGGWLCRATHFAARDVVRAEIRRRAREQEAPTMHDPSTADDHAKIDWEKLQPVLNATMGELNDADRNAVWLRFFEGRSFAEVGTRLRLTENAARMRVERALDKLHAALARRGIASTSAALGAALTNQAAATAPAAFAVSVTGAALAGVGAAGGGLAGFFMNMTTLQIGGAVAILAIGATGFLAQARTSTELRAEIAALQEQERDVPRLRDENTTLERAAIEVARLRAESTDLARLREEVAVARRTQPKVSTATGQPFAPLPAVKNADEKVRLSMPDADIDTALSAIKALSGWQVVRDASLGRGIVNVRMREPLTKTQALELMRAALRDQAGVVLERGPNGTVLVKRATGR